MKASFDSQSSPTKLNPEDRIMRGNQNSSMTQEEQSKLSNTLNDYNYDKTCKLLKDYKDL